MENRLQSIFISYRRSDSDALAGRLRDRLSQILPDWSVFMDVTSIQAGIDFRVAIENALDQSSFFLLLIGRNWLSTRLQSPDDPIVQEIKSALRLKLRVIPVLINDAKMPSHEEIPEDLRDITWLNAVELRHSRFDDDFRFLVSVICPEARPQNRQSFVDGKNFVQGRGRIRVGATGAILGLAAGLLLLMISFQVTGRSASEWIGNDGAVLLLPLFAVLGAGAGLFLAHRRVSH